MKPKFSYNITNLPIHSSLLVFNLFNSIQCLELEFKQIKQTEWSKSANLGFHNGLLLISGTKPQGGDRKLADLFQSRALFN